MFSTRVGHSIYRCADGSFSSGGRNSSAGSASSWSEGVVSGIVAGSSEKKKDEGVGEVFMSLEPRLEGLTTSGFISFASFLLVAYQESTPTTEKKIINRGKNLRIFCFMLGIVPVEVEEVKL